MKIIVFGVMSAIEAWFAFYYAPFIIPAVLSGLAAIIMACGKK